MRLQNVDTSYWVEEGRRDPYSSIHCISTAMTGNMVKLFIHWWWHCSKRVAISDKVLGVDSTNLISEIHWHPFSEFAPAKNHLLPHIFLLHYLGDPAYDGVMCSILDWDNLCGDSRVQHVSYCVIIVNPQSSLLLLIIICCC